MSAFGGLIFTNVGRNLQAKAQAGATLNFTQIAIGDGDLGGSAIADLTNLKHQVKSCNITKLKTMTGGKAVVGTTFSNSDIVSGFYWKELGIYAQDPDLGEILYCYGNAGANAEYIPAGGGPDIVEKSIDAVTIVGNASSISATIDSSLVYVSMQAFGDHLNNNVVHIMQLDRDMWNAKETPAGAQAKADAAAAAGISAAALVQTDLDEHKAEKATLTQIGHVKAGASISVAADGTMSATAASVGAATPADVQAARIRSFLGV